MDRIRCFFLQPTDQVEIWLRRFVWSELQKCPKSIGGYHDASVMIGRDHEKNVPIAHEDCWPHADTRWPKSCACGYEFSVYDQWQFNPYALYRRSDNQELVTLNAAPAGAMWFAPWYSECDEFRGLDGNTLVVRCPTNHDWIVDGRASNCTLPQDKEHKCWVRHGAPPEITVDKNGKTCAAGAGSILVPGWHGFLRAGYLES